MGKTPTTSTKDIPNGANSPQRKKIVIGQKLPFSPRTKVPTVNKVFVLGTQLGIILLRTQRQSNSNEDAYTQDAIKLIEDETTGVASKLNIIKICSRRQSKLIDQALMQTSNYPSRWFVSIVPEEKNTHEFRVQHAERFIKFLNGIDWKYPQQFNFQADETKTLNGKIATSLDMFLLNCDIVILLKVYLFENLEDFFDDTDALNGSFGPDSTKDQVKLILEDLWNNL
jgi:hypothetical protein